MTPSWNVVAPSKLSEAQESCEDVKKHREGLMPRGIKMENVVINGFPLYCEVSDPNNPRPLVPKAQREVILNLLHHQDHPSARETLRRVSKDYYWPCVRHDVEGFVKTCRPCKLAKQARSVNPGTGYFPVPDQRFTSIHLDVVGPLRSLRVKGSC